MAAALDEVKDELDDDVVLAAQDFCDAVGDPSGRGGGLLLATRGDTSVGRSGLLLHDLHIDLLHVHLLVELGRELGALEELRVHAGGHGCRPFFFHSGPSPVVVAGRVLVARMC